MILNYGNYRIFRDKEQKDSQMKKRNESEENIPNFILSDYIKEVIEPIKMKYSYKFNSISKEYFEDKEKKIRNLSKIGYRLLTSSALTR